MIKLLSMLLLGVLAIGCQNSGTHPAKSAAQARAGVETAGPVESQITYTPTPTDSTIEIAAAERSSARGQPAPQFTLPDELESAVSLESLRGQWVVLYFYPADDTPACECQATEFTRLLKAFKSNDAVVLGVSPDSAQSHRKFIKKYRLALRLLSDPQKGVMREYGAWVDVEKGPAAPGRVIRSTYLIDPAGTIAWHWPEVIPKGHAQRVMDKLIELQTAAAKPDSVTKTD